MYTIGQVSKIFHLPISALRYYDKEGLFPDIERSSGIRKFREKEIKAPQVIKCLKKSGMEIKDIKQFMKWCSERSSTYPQRRKLFLNQKNAVENEIRRMEKVLDMLRFKSCYYEQAIKDNKEDRLNEMIPDNLPKKIQAAYHHAHKE